jgi:branched-chain amino acid transport system ATP-binding protein
VLALNYGRVLASGPPTEVQSHPDVIAAYLGT